MNQLTVEDIRKIRETHACETKQMSFGDYQKALKQEIAGALEVIQKMKLNKMPAGTRCVCVSEDGGKYGSQHAEA